MTEDAGHRDDASRARRPGPLASLVIAALLLLGGGIALTVGLLDQDAAPPAPAAEATTARSPSPTAGASPPPATTKPPTTSPTAPLSEPVPAPVSVHIPAIEVQSQLITVGLNPDGTLEVPQPGPNYDKAAWFREGPRPGEPGPAVIEGHVDSAANGPSVFYDLGRLVTGDRIEVTGEDGTVAVFEVYDVRVVPKDDFPRLDVYGNTPGPELRLITCGGPFDSSAGSYVDNVVVFAQQV